MQKNEQIALDYYSSHSIFSNPCEYGELFKEIPNDVKEIVRIVQGLLINPLDEDIYNIKFSSQQRSELHFRTAAQIIAHIQKLNASPLTVKREHAMRLSGIGRHFGILLLSILRHKGIPSRMRVGFVTYLDKKKYEDRWLVEYWDAKEKKWILIDPCIDDQQREHYGITFDTLNMSYGEHFYLAGHAWQLVKDNKAKANDFGYKNYYGKRFIRNNLVREMEGLNKIEMLPWDYFGNLNMKTDSELNKEEKILLDRLAGLSVEADNNFNDIQEMYNNTHHSRLVSSKLQLLGLINDVKLVNASNLQSINSEWDDLFQVEVDENKSSHVRNADEVLNMSGFNDVFNSRIDLDMDKILIRGARQHNLKNIDVDIPRSKFVVITGVSGSGKSSLAFNTIYAEGQRRFVESFSEGAGQYSKSIEKPDVDQIVGMNPVIAIEQKNGSTNPRSTVGTLTDIYDYLRVLFARVGTMHCPQCGRVIKSHNKNQIVNKLLTLKEGTTFNISAFIDNSVKTVDPMAEQFQVPEFRGDEWSSYSEHLLQAVEKALKMSEGSISVSVEGKNDIIFSEKNICATCNLELIEMKPSLFNPNHPDGMCSECDGLGIKLSVDPDLIITQPERSMLDGACKVYGDMRKSLAKPNSVTAQVFTLADNMNVDLEQPWTQLPKAFRDAILYGTGNECIEFTYEMAKGGRSSTINRPMEGLVNMINRLYRNTKAKKTKETHLQYMSEQPCAACKGEGVCAEARYVIVGKTRFPEVAIMTIDQVREWIKGLQQCLSGEKHIIAKQLLQAIWVRVNFLTSIGLHYLSLDRTAPTLSGGELQRIRLATQLGSGLVGILYVLDEPSIGLHPRDHSLLITAMRNLRDSGNTVLVVEHDSDTMIAADHIIEIGPGAGALGGHLIAEGSPEAIMANKKSITGKYLKGELMITSPHGCRRKSADGWLTLEGAKANNLKNITTKFPLGILSCITGVSGSGKSSLVGQTLAPALRKLLHHSNDIAGSYKSLTGVELIDKVIIVNQTSIGRTPRSNPATYIGVFDQIREIFANTDESKSRGITADKYSFNIEGGRCESCKGLGIKKVELHFMPDAWVTCQECNGNRYSNEILKVKYRGKTITDVLEMDVNEALNLFVGEKKISKILGTLHDVGLSYIKLGQSALTLSGGEAQRLKLAKELCRPDTGKTVYILDEPTTGLHFDDIQKLLQVLHSFTQQGNTVILIEHNLDVIKTADWVIDIGPKGGAEGGRIVAEGTPEQVVEIEESYTGAFLKKLL